MKRLLLIWLLLCLPVTAYSGYQVVSSGYVLVGANPGAGTGDVVGPASSIDNCIVRFDGTTGLLLQGGANCPVYLDTTGFAGFGTITPVTGVHEASALTTSPRGIMSSQHNDGTDGARLHLRKSRGTNATPLTVVTGDMLGALVSSGHDGANYLEMARIEVISSGTVTTTRIPTAIKFYTATDATPSVLTERMTLNNLGYLGIGIAPTATLHVSGSTIISGTIFSNNFGSGSGASYSSIIHGGTGQTITFSTNNINRVLIDAVGNLIKTPPSAQTITSGDTITADACGGMKPITAGGAVTTGTTNTFTAPTSALSGCCMDVVNVGTANTITLDNNANFFSAGGANVAMTANDSVRVCNNGTAWYQISAVLAN